jgi:hypothetical protein
VLIIVEVCYSTNCDPDEQYQEKAFHSRPLEPVQQQQSKRKHDVELHFDSKRPGPWHTLPLGRHKIIDVEYVGPDCLTGLSI